VFFVTEIDRVLCDVFILANGFAGSEDRLIPHRCVVEGMSHLTTKQRQEHVLKAATACMKAILAIEVESKGFDDLNGIATSFVYVQPLPEAQRREYIHFECSCPDFCQYFVCHHVLAWGLSQKIIEVPANRLMTSIGRVPMRGRPRNAPSALERLPHEDASRFPHFASADHPNAACLSCLSTISTDANPILFCDKCNKGYHKQCAGVRRIPTGSWYCMECNA
jgi:hypothetical protein